MSAPSNSPKPVSFTARASTVAVVDRRPFFEKALSHGVAKRIIDADRRAAIIADGAKGTVQVAQYFGSSHLFAALDNARKRVVTLVSLYLEEQCGGDLDQAAQSLRDNSFLSHSRGGNALLKLLHAMPESSMFESGQQGQALKEFQDERTLARPMTFAAYRKEWQRRQANARMQDAARWFAQSLQINEAALDAVPAEAVIRTGLLCMRQEASGCPDRQVFAGMLNQLRSAASTATSTATRNTTTQSGARKTASHTVTKTASQPAAGKVKPATRSTTRALLPKSLVANVPTDHQAIVEVVRREIERQDLPMLAQSDIPLDEVFSRLELRYFLRETGLEDIDAYDAFVSQEWSKLTKGKEDQFSRLTLFLCLAAGVTPRVTLSMTEAKALIRSARKTGLDQNVVSTLIESAAPFTIRESLLSTWEEEWFPEAGQFLCDPADEAADNKYLGALRYLTENCNVRKT